MRFEHKHRSPPGATSYQKELSNRAQAKAGFNALIVKARFSASVDYEKMEKGTTQTNSSFTHATAECEA